MAKDPKVGELVDDHGLESLRRRKYETPRKGQAALARGATPACPLVADADGGRRDAEGRRMSLDVARDLASRAALEPGLKNGGC